MGDHWIKDLDTLDDPNKITKERLERRIESLIYSREEELSQVKITVRNQTKRELMDQVRDLEEQLKKRASTIEGELEEIKDTVYSKDRYITYLLRYISEQELLITQFRLSSLPAPVREARTRLDTSVIEKELECCRQRLENMTELCDSYQKELQKSKERVKELEQDIILIKDQYQKELEASTGHLNAVINELKQKNHEIQKDLEKFKLNCTSELESRETIQGRQQNIICSLQDELKNIKTVIMNPTMTQKVIGKKHTFDLLRHFSYKSTKSKNISDRREESFNSVMRSTINTKTKPVFYMSYRSSSEFQSAPRITRKMKTGIPNKY